MTAVVVGVDVSGLVGGELASLLANVRAAQRSLDGLVIRIGVRSNQLAAVGRAAPAEEVVRGGGAVGAGQARREAARARVAEEISGLGEAVSAAETTGEHLDAIARHVSKLDERQRAGFDFGSLVAKAKEMPVETFDRLVKRRIDSAIADHGLGDALAKRAGSEFRHWFDRDAGMGRFSGSLDPERYEALTTAIDQRMVTMARRSGEPVTKNNNLGAEALVELVTSAGVRDARNRLPHVTVVVDHDTVVHGAHDRSIRQTEAGHDIAQETVARLCCDAVIRRVTLDRDGVPIDVGRKYRTATDGQWAAIKAVHTCCAWNGCDAPINWCQAHHIREWDTGGPTNMENLIPLCSRHHHRVHEGQWHIKLSPERTLEIYRPDGTHHATVPVSATVEAVGDPDPIRPGPGMRGFGVRTTLVVSGLEF